MKKQRFTGPMGEKIMQHLALRRSLGYIYQAVEYTLDAFDQFLDKNHPNCTTITRDMIVGYIKTTQDKLPLTRAGHITHLRQFCRFMFQLDNETYIPEKGLIPPGKVQVEPYIFTQNDINKVMEQANNLNAQNKLLAQTYATIIGLLWTTGMRIGEVIRLKIEDIDHVNGVLYVRQTKFFKSRAIPLLPSTAQKLKTYLTQREKQGYKNVSDDFVFINNQGHACTISTTPRTIRTLIIRAGIKSPNNHTPRVHDIRHSFATNWLRDIYQSGKDPNSYLPVLATYMGHANIANTQVYLHPSVELLGVAGKKLQSYVQSKQGEHNEEK